MAESRELARYRAEGGAEVVLDAATVQKALTRGDGEVTIGEMKLFVELCKAKRMNPFEGDCYLIKYGKGDRSQATMVTGKGFFLKRAEANPRCKGFKAGIYVITAQGNYKEREGSMLLPNEQLLGGWAEVYKEGWEHPVKETVAFGEYTTGKSGWAKMPATMIRKVALCHALREAFPNDYSGLYSEEEMAQAAEEQRRQVQSVECREERQEAAQEPRRAQEAPEAVNVPDAAREAAQEPVDADWEPFDPMAYEQGYQEQLDAVRGEAA